MSQQLLEIVEYRLPQRHRIQDLVKALVQSFPFQVESVRQGARCYYDTVDWYLYSKGYVIVSESDAGPFRLQMRRITSLAGQRTLILDSVPRFAHEFPGRVWQQRMSSLLDQRELIPQLTLQYRIVPLRYLDTRAKTCLQLFIENNRLKQEDAGERQLGKCIRLLPVKGYESVAKQIMRFLERQMALVPLKEAELNSGLALLQREPAVSDPSKVEALDPNTPTAVALGKILLPILGVMESREPGVLYDDAPEYLHDFRVAVRRTRSILGELKGVFDRRRTQRFRNDFAWLGEVTGPVRDLQVYLGRYDGYRHTLPRKMRPYLAPLKVMLENRLIKEKESLRRHLLSSHYRQLKQGWRGFLTQQSAGSAGVLKKGQLPVKQVADDCIWERFQMVLNDGKVISSASPAEKLHRLRIDCKKLRYLMEFFTSLYPAEAMRRLIKALKRLQDNLGDFHDLQVQIGSLRKFQELMAKEKELSPETQVALDQLIAHLNELQFSQRQMFAERFSRFSAHQHQALFATLFAPGKGKATSC